jgi:copper chaperone CopZ
MEKAVLNVPTLWADHHVLKVREVLGSLSGIEDVYASSAWKQILVTYDAAKTDRAAVERALAEAGYPIDQGETPVLVQAGLKGRDPKWEVLGARVTQTDRVDLEMSGEFRKY